MTQSILRHNPAPGTRGVGNAWANRNPSPLANVTYSPAESVKEAAKESVRLAQLAPVGVDLEEHAEGIGIVNPAFPLIDTAAELAWLDHLYQEADAAWREAFDAGRPSELLHKKRGDAARRWTALNNAEGRQVIYLSDLVGRLLSPHYRAPVTVASVEVSEEVRQVREERELILEMTLTGRSLEEVHRDQKEAYRATQPARHKAESTDGLVTVTKSTNFQWL